MLDHLNQMGNEYSGLFTVAKTVFGMLATLVATWWVMRRKHAREVEKLQLENEQLRVNIAGSFSEQRAGLARIPMTLKSILTLEAKTLGYEWLACSRVFNKLRNEMHGSKVGDHGIHQMQAVGLLSAEASDRLQALLTELAQLEVKAIQSQQNEMRKAIWFDWRDRVDPSMTDEEVMETDDFKATMESPLEEALEDYRNETRPFADTRTNRLFVETAKPVVERAKVLITEFFQQGWPERIPPPKWWQVWK